MQRGRGLPERKLGCYQEQGVKAGATLLACGLGTGRLGVYTMCTQDGAAFCRGIMDLAVGHWTQ